MNTTPDIAQLPIYCVYRHVRPDKDIPFYIGIGGGKRPHKAHNRNQYWQNIYKLNNKQIEVDILAEGLTWQEAIEKEIWWIAFYGRWNTGKGPLVNLTDGGEGGLGYIPTEEAKRKFSEKMKGNRSHTGKIHITNGVEDTLIYKSESIPEGWYRGRVGGGHEWTLQERQEISKQRKGRKLNLSDEERKARSTRTKGNSGSSGKKWINDGYKSLYIPIDLEVPTGWRLGRIKTWKTVPPPSKVGKIWINNGTNLKYIDNKEPIPSGWNKGYIFTKKVQLTH